MLQKQQPASKVAPTKNAVKKKSARTSCGENSDEKWDDLHGARLE